MRNGGKEGLLFLRSESRRAESWTGAADRMTETDGGRNVKARRPEKYPALPLPPKTTLILDRLIICEGLKKHTHGAVWGSPLQILI